MCILTHLPDSRKKSRTPKSLLPKTPAFIAPFSYDALCLAKKKLVCFCVFCADHYVCAPRSPWISSKLQLCAQPHRRLLKGWDLPEGVPVLSLLFDACSVCKKTEQPCSLTSTRDPAYSMGPIHFVLHLIILNFSQ